MNTTGVIAVITILISLLIIHQLIEKYFLKIVKRNIYFKNIDEQEGFKICHITDLHSFEFGEGNQKLADIINREKPDCLCMTGDFLDNGNDDGSSFINFMSRIHKDIKKLYVFGNHETYSKIKFDKIPTNRNDFFNRLKENDIYLLHGTNYDFKDKKVNIAGILDDYRDYNNKDFKEETFDIGKKMIAPKEGFLNIALVHRPNYFRSFSKYGYDLMLSGHFHGGIINLPVLGGVLCPDVKFFPEFDKGLFKYGKSYMNLSSGLYNPKPIPKLNNRPELIFITLRKGNEDSSAKLVK